MNKLEKLTKLINVLRDNRISYEYEMKGQRVYIKITENDFCFDLGEEK